MVARLTVDVIVVINVIVIRFVNGGTNGSRKYIALGGSGRRDCGGRINGSFPLRRFGTTLMIHCGVVSTGMVMTTMMMIMMNRMIPIFIVFLLLMLLMEVIL